MRFADILLDLAAVAKASRSIASRHLELRTKQLDRYSQTSSIIRSIRHDQVKPQGNVQQSTTESTRDAANDGIDQEVKDSVIPEIIPSGGKRAVKGDTFKTVFNPKDAAAKQHIAPPLDRSAILAQLRENAGLSEKQGHKATISGTMNNPPDYVPQGVNIDVFHTKRGSQIIGGQGDAVGRLRPKAPPPKPSWFKDFGHDQLKVLDEHKGGKPLPSISKAKGQGRSPVEESAAAADVAIASPQLGDSTRPSIVEDSERSPARGAGVDPSPGVAGQDTFTQVGASHPPNAREPDAAQPEKDTTHKDKYARETREHNETKQSETLASSPDEPPTPVYALRESKVPATRLSRIWNYGGLAAGMLGGALTEGISRGFGGGGQGSVMFSSGNMERLVAKLSRMRGAALKLGQMMSFQDSKMLPGPIQEVLQRVQDRADYMPAWQRDRVLIASLGPEWRDLFEDFEETPIAAASIGQVHRATLKSGEKVAVKIQFPGVADSINSDLDNISMLLMASGVLPKGLYLDKTIDNARIELGWECDYERELACGRRYKELLADEGDVFAVPEIHDHASGKHVLTMQFMEGVGVTRVKSFTQAQRDWIGTQILRLCLREIVEFRFMQTDPNWTNFLYNATTNRLELLDFGASREFPAAFVSQYVALLAAAARRDREAIITFSQRLGYLTGHESRAMLDAHVASILTLAEPFLQSAPEVYDFADQTITERVRDLIPVMVRERLSPPPEETYSLHRKLSGAFLLCARLGSRVRCRELFERALEKVDLESEV